MLSFATSLKG